MNVLSRSEVLTVIHALMSKAEVESSRSLDLVDSGPQEMSPCRFKARATK
jgi:hypothetical protein